MTDVPGKLPDADAARSPDPAWISSAMTGGGSQAGGPVMAAVPVGPATGGRPLRPARGARRPEFDVMRAFVVAGLVVFHSAVVFAAGTSWFVKDPRPDRGFTVFLLWGVVVGDAAAVPGLGDGRAVCDADPPGSGVRPGAAGPTDNRVQASTERQAPTWRLSRRSHERPAISGPPHPRLEG